MQPRASLHTQEVCMKYAVTTKNVWFRVVIVWRVQISITKTPAFVSVNVRVNRRKGMD